ncbi:MAG: hypothetical protein JO189_31260 [Deltaproteobacteria bacterium]|nr:hypothetical protein [Deltaproteobacteria bacterium]
MIFVKLSKAQWQTYLLGSGIARRGPKPGLAVNEIIALLLVLHSFRFKYLKNFYGSTTISGCRAVV